MAAEAVSAERAYQLLKRDVVSGRFVPGGGIVERVLAAEYGLSIAPFRDAAQRLVGERLLAFGTRGGYRLPAVTEAGLRDLYQWHNHLVRLALKASPGPLRDDPVGVRSPITVDTHGTANETTAMFKAIAAQAAQVANAELAQALLAANDRLHPIRLREALVLRNLDAELETVRSLIGSGRDDNRFAVIWAYHRRRVRRASSIVRAFYNP